jgi:phytoene dehydrogenase-like protein
MPPHGHVSVQIGFAPTLFLTVRLSHDDSESCPCLQIIPDIDDRVKLTCIGTPLSHARFLRRKCGTYGPANLLNLTGALPKAVQPLENVWCCGDSVFPGVGTPAVAANGMWVANTLIPVKRHMKMLEDLGL